MARTVATNDRVDRGALPAFIGPRHRATLVTTRRDGRPQLSPVTSGVDDLGRLVVATYPSRAKVATCAATPPPALIRSDEWDGPWVQVDGVAEVIDMPDALQPLVDYYRSIAGEHPDWDEYRTAMRDQGTSLIRLATGGLSPELAD